MAPSCPSGKTRYNHPTKASAALRAIRENPKTEKIPDRLYQCPLCAGWHLTSIKVEDQPPREFARAPRRGRKRKKW